MDCLNHKEIMIVRRDPSIRDVMLFQIILDTGCLLSELVMIKLKDIKGASIFLGRRNKRRRVVISHFTRRKIREYIKGLPESTDSRSFLLTSRESLTISPRRVEQILSDLGYRTINKRITPRLLRTTSIIRGFQSQEPIKSIESRTGLNSIARYAYDYMRWNG